LDVQVRVELITFSPEEAARILAEQDEGNFRALRPKLVKGYSMEMAHGRWLVNSETIKFGPEGELLDGQHRLAACAMAHQPFTTWVAYDVDPATVHTMDMGRKRTLADWLHHKGYSSTLHLAAAISLGWRWETDNLLSGVRPGPNEALSWLARNHDIVEAVKITQAYAPLRSVDSATACFTWKAIRLAPEEEVAFRHALLSGEMPHRNHPVLLLRNYLTTGIARKRHERPDQVVMLAMLIKTWNAVMEGRNLKYLGYRNSGMKREIFPAMHGPQNEAVINA
jgi:hypothetical protein